MRKTAVALALAGLAVIGTVAGFALGRSATNASPFEVTAKFQKGLASFGWPQIDGVTGYALLYDGTQVAIAGPAATSTRFSVGNGQHTLTVQPLWAPLTTTTATTSATTTTAPTTTVAPPPVPYSGRIGLWRLGGSISGFSHLTDYSTVVVSASGMATARTLPGRTLIYTDASGVHSGYTEGFSYTSASANGCLLGKVGTSDYYVVDHSKSACNQLQADADVAYAKSAGLKGMYLDDVVPQNPYGVTTPAGWEAGMVSFVHLLHQQLKAVGLYLMTNANAFTDPSLGNGDDGTGDLNWAKQLAPDGVLEESWESRRDGSNIPRTQGVGWTADFDQWLSMARGLQAAGIDFVGLTYGHPDWGYAAALLADNGRTTFVSVNLDSSDPWGSWVKDAGAPLGSATTVGACETRKFANVTVYVNPTTSAQTCDGHTLAAASALIVP